MKLVYAYFKAEIKHKEWFDEEDHVLRPAGWYLVARVKNPKALELLCEKYKSIKVKDINTGVPAGGRRSDLEDPEEVVSSQMTQTELQEYYNQFDTPEV